MPKMDQRAKQLAAATYYGEVCAFNYVIENWPVKLEEIIELRDAMRKSGELVAKHGIKVILD